MAGTISALAGAALADAPLRSPRPVARAGSAPETGPGPERPARVRPRARRGLGDVIAAAGLPGAVSVLLADAGTGRPLERHAADRALPPASVTKALTSLYGLDALGPGHRFVTRLLGTGPVRDGRLLGDLVLAGGGDPTCVTNDLAQLAADLRAAGVREVTGRFLVWGGALPYEDEIDAGQLDHLSYNPAVSGLNLNFNRVHFEWERDDGGYEVTLQARSSGYAPDVTVARMEVEDRGPPVYTYDSAGEIDLWTVAEPYLGAAGARWLPVRRPSLYAGDVFRTLAGVEGIRLPAPRRATAAPAGRPLASHRSAALRPILADMLKYSTNLTAEVVGLSATAAAASATPPGIVSSAAAMSRWLDARHGTGCRFVDHSGLGDASRITAADMVRVLNGRGVHRRLAPILKPVDVRGTESYPARVRAKTGTLNFVSALGGYLETGAGRVLSFAILSAELQERERSKRSAEEIPPGSREWIARARTLQQTLLRRWGSIYA